MLEYLKKEVGDGREAFLANQIISSLKTVKDKALTSAKFMDNDMLLLLQELSEDYTQILKERSKKKVDSTLQNKYLVVSFKIKLLIKFYMQQLIQVHDGLLYLNDRPYSLAIYLMFGEYFIEELIKNVTFRIESV